MILPAAFRNARPAITALLLCSPHCFGWGPEGHRVVGVLALKHLSATAQNELTRITGTRDPLMIAGACNWPDEYRASPEGAWSAPQHYINVPRQESAYDRERDCPEGACVAGAIRTYAAELGNPELSSQRRWQAWARVCHYVGDIHQPLHVGFRHDRGGNDFDVVFRGKIMDLHEFWDHALIDSNHHDWKLLAEDLAVIMGEPLTTPWRSHQTDEWAHESHALVRSAGYPMSAEITPEFAAARWRLARQRLILAGRRLAQLLNTVLDSETVEPGP